MQVSGILKSKASNELVTVTPDTPVSQAVDLLAQKKIGTVLVSRDGQHADGILSERDVVRAMAQHGADVLDSRVDTLMTTNLVTCKRGDSSVSVMEKMTEGRFRHMPVVENGTLIGLISVGDVVKSRLSELSLEKDALEGMIMGY